MDFSATVTACKIITNTKNAYTTMKSKTRLLLIAGLTTSAILQGQITVFTESFDYPTGNDAFLSESNWQADTSTPVGGVVTGAFSTAGLHPLGSTDKAVRVFGGDKITTSIGTTASFDSTYYFSYLLNTNNAETSLFQFRSSNNRQMEIGLEGNKFGVGVSTGDFGANGTSPVANGQEYFVVGAVRVDDDGARFGQDSFSIAASIFTSGADAQAWASGVNTTTLTASDWDFSELNADFPTLGNAAYAFDSITLTSNSGIAIYDEIRIATDLGAVVGSGTVAVPEPSTYALLSGLAMLGLVLFRRRRR